VIHFQVGTITTLKIGNSMKLSRFQDSVFVNENLPAVTKTKAQNNNFIFDFDLSLFSFQALEKDCSTYIQTEHILLYKLFII
jgi:hypothetical protein